MAADTEDDNTTLLTSEGVAIDKEQGCIIFTMNAELPGGASATFEIPLNCTAAIVCANALREAGRLLQTSEPGDGLLRPLPYLLMKVEHNRGGVVVTFRLNMGDEQYFWPAGPGMNRCADALLAAVLELQMPNQAMTTIMKH